MTTPYSLLRGTASSSSDVSAHLFAVGQAVRLKGRFPGLTSRVGDIYHVTAVLPPSGNVLQYRIRNENEKHERMMMEDDLEAVTASTSSEAALIEKTFRGV